MWVTAAILALAGIAVLISRKPELLLKWRTWVLIAPVVGFPMWIGEGTTAGLAAALAIVAVIEYARLTQLRKGRHLRARGAGRDVPARGVAAPVPVAPGTRRRAAAVRAAVGTRRRRRKRCQAKRFHRIRVGVDLLVAVAPGNGVARTRSCCASPLRPPTSPRGVAERDCAAWAWARRPLSPLSPNKTVGGLVGAIIGAFVILTLLGTISIGLLIAVSIGGVFGDLLESMLKRQAQVKDAGDLAAGLRRPARPDRFAIARPPVGVLPRMSGGGGGGGDQMISPTAHRDHHPLRWLAAHIRIRSRHRRRARSPRRRPHPSPRDLRLAFDPAPPGRRLGRGRRQQLQRNIRRRGQRVQSVDVRRPAGQSTSATPTVPC